MERASIRCSISDDSDTFVLLDDCEATSEKPYSRLYTGYVREIVCTDCNQIDKVVDEVEDEIRRGLHAIVVADYEFGAQLQLRGTHEGKATFLVFEQCTRLCKVQVDQWLCQKDGGAATPSLAGVTGITPSVNAPEFADAIQSIHESLHAGDAYQINFTYRLEFDVIGHPIGLYRRLRSRQPVRYGALMSLPTGEWVLSCSPELFASKGGPLVRCRPMKGTAPRSSDPDVDRGAARFLSTDPKNRAENVMIVDLLRNDLSRIAEIGTVRTPALFTIEEYPSVWQMTSTVEATIRRDCSFADILRALFPCGSITGAPKHMSMQLIKKLENTPRGIYTGAIGWLEAPPLSDGDRVVPACGDFCLSVAIRTITISAPSPSNTRRGRLGVGGGIVLDSHAKDEHAETLLKARFLTETEPMAWVN
ncbi:chorismate-binding protein [Paraburkholderia elongata]|uniref:chorismate-binding protein n=1 Tax=Paraburkholderia elongata TaxID=2675747 RepID=UPI00155216DF|nr:chorismate-binding protein [Paraburkholderia elongata]